MKLIRASEIASYLYCARAWWYQSQGQQSENQMEIAGGNEFHHQHGQQVWTARLLRFAGWGLMLLAIILLAVALTIQWLN
jgi:hypothetical protein